MKTTSCTDNTSYAFNRAPRCGAKTKRNNGSPCRSPAIRGKKRCRMHGGGKGSGGQIGNTNAVIHGYTTTEVKIFKRTVKELIKATDALVDVCNS